MKKYTLSSKLFDGSITLAYNELGYLVYYNFEAQMSEEQQKYWIERFPTKMQDLQVLSATTSLSIKEVPQDLSFANFWQSYSYKVGSKVRSEKLWNALCDADKLLVFTAIPAYDYFLACKKNQDKMYPETFLSKRAFEVEYVKLIKR